MLEMMWNVRWYSYCKNSKGTPQNTKNKMTI